jgi:small GTP-binding protein
MSSIEEQIQDLEEEIKNTPYNKSTQHHIGKLKAKVAKLRDEMEKRRTQRIGTGQVDKGYGVKKSGNATVAIVGFPSTGKSTLLNQITDADSEVGAYQFTTLNVIPGLMEYKGAKIQILDMPGLLKGASKGKGRGREVIAAARSSDLALLMVDVYSYDINVLVKELYSSGIRLNQRPANIVITKRPKGGLDINTTVKLTHLDEDMIASILSEYGFINADVVIRTDINDDQLIDYIRGNRIYIPAIAVLNKIDLVSKKDLNMIINHLDDWDVVPISADKNKGVNRLKKTLYDKLKFIRLYMKPQRGKTDYEEPLVIKSGSDVGMVCDTIHRSFRKNFRYAQVWGRSAKFPGQVVGLNHGLKDQDVITIVVKKM